MNRNSENQSFLQQIFENLGTILALVTPIAQYLFRDEFSAVLNIGDNIALFNAFTLVAVIFGFTIILGLFANKQLLHTKLYLNKNKKLKYFKSIQPKVEADNDNQRTEQEVIEEPFFLDANKYALISLILSATAFAFIFIFQDALFKNIAYLVFILSVVFSLTVYVLKIYQFEEWKYLEDKKIQIINEHIQSYFAKPIKTFASVEDNKDIFNQYRILFVEVEGKKYKVTSDRNNPNKFFEVSELPQ